MNLQKQKNISLMVILAVLVAISLLLGLVNNQIAGNAGGAKVFQVPDTSAVDMIKIHYTGESIELKKVNDTWMLNDIYHAEENIITVLLAILKDAESLRKLPKSQAEGVSNTILEHGADVEISGRGSVISSFRIAGNDTKTMTYVLLKDEEIPMIVHIPGYESYIAGIFEIPANDWRDRTILSTNWRTLQELEVEYTQFPEYNFAIRFKDNFLTIAGIHTLDTAAMMDYIGQFYQLQADKFIERQENNRYDSLLSTPETVRMHFYDINAENSKTIRFFPLLPNDPMMLGYVEEDNQMALFQARRIQSWFAVKDEFIAE